MKDWVQATLGEVCHVYQPRTLAQKELRPGAFPVFGANGQIGWHDEFNHEAEQLAIGCRGSVGFVHITPERTWINGNAMVVVPNQDTIERDFLAYALRGGIDISASISGAAQPQITRASLVPIPIAYPVDVSEQRRIVAILDEAFEGIATAKANTEKNLQNARDLFDGTLQSVFANQGDRWETKSVSEWVSEGVLAKPQDGNHGEIHPTKADYVDSGVPFVMAADLVDGAVDTVSCRFIGEAQARSLRIGFAKSGDVLLSHKGTIGRVAILETDEDFVVLTPQVTYYRPLKPDRLCKEFLYFSLMNPSFQSQMSAIAGAGSTRAYIGITRQLDLKIALPPLPEQIPMASRLRELQSAANALVETYERKLAALDELKKSLLHQAFSGQL